MDYPEKIAEVCTLIGNSSANYVLTGAGISTESGIPDYRSPETGLWQAVVPLYRLRTEASHESPVRTV